jgi:hypothetical protein
MATPLKLMVENDFRDYEIIVESKESKQRKIIIRGPYIVTEKRNENGRVYSRSKMEKCVDVFNEKMIKTGRALGELEHPPTIEIDLKKACHRITSLEQDGNIWIGESVVLCTSADGTIKGTANGDALAAIVQYGGKPGMSTRGAGYANDRSGLVEEYELITVDAVSKPSGPGCFVKGILESKDFMINTHGYLVECAYTKLEKDLEYMPGQVGVNNREKQAKMERILREFINRI